MNREIEILTTEENLDKFKILRLNYNDVEFKLSFPKEEVQQIKISDDIIISTETLYKELSENQLFDKKQEILLIKDDKLVEEGKILSKFIFIQRIIDSFSHESFNKDFSIANLIEASPFFINLKSISLIWITIKLLKNYITDKKLMLASNEDKATSYLFLIQSFAFIQEELISQQKNNNEIISIKNYIGIYNEFVDTLIFLAITLSKKELRFLINTIKKQYLKEEAVSVNKENNNNASYILINRDYFLIINIVKIIIISLINNKEISSNDKLEILIDLILDKNRIIKIHTTDNSLESYFNEISHEMFSFYDKNINSSKLTRSYNQVIILNRNNIEDIIKTINFILTMNNENEEIIYLDSSTLLKKLSTFSDLFDFNESNDAKLLKELANDYYYIKNSIKNNEVQDEKTEELINTDLEKNIEPVIAIKEQEDQLSINKDEIIKFNEVLMKEDNFSNKYKEIIQIDKINIDNNGCIYDTLNDRIYLNINNLILPIHQIYRFFDYLDNSSKPNILNNFIAKRGYNPSSLRDLLKSLDKYNRSPEINIEVFQVLGKLIIFIYQYL